MTQSNQQLLTQTIEKRLAAWQLTERVQADDISHRILERTGYWAVTLPDRDTLALVRLYAPVVQRQEVFLGNVLLNDFLFKALPRATTQAELGEATLLLNDLENAYFLWRGNGDLEALREAYRAEVLAALPDLYFDSEDLGRGIHGDVRGMLTFYKCNIEPFPTFIIPQAYLDRLLETVGEWLRLLVNQTGAEALAEATRIPVESAQSRRINVVLSLLSFFYHQDGTEMQSFYTFLKRAIEDGRLPGDEVKTSFGVGPDEDFSKKLFEERKKGNVIDFEALAQAVEIWLKKVEKAISEGRALDVTPQLGKSKMLALEPEAMVAHLLSRVQIGYLPSTTVKEPPVGDGMTCRFCGASLAVIAEKNILGGSGTGNRFNQSLRRSSQRFCLRCALSSYLATKRLGMHFDGGFPVPRLYNIIFHYGRHTDWEIEAIQRQIDYVLAHAAKKETADLIADLKEIQENVAAQHDVFLEDSPELDFGDWTEPALEVTAQMQQDVKAEVIPLGSGDYRLLVFILPQLRPGTKEGLDFVQKRFSRSRLAIYTLLGLLRQLCGCDGPYYFQSLPTLALGGFAPNTFYVNGRPEQADAALRRYGAIVNFARRVVQPRKGYSYSLLGDWILLAEQLERDPLGVFSDVLRASPIRGGDDLSKARYKRLSNDFVPGMAVVDSAEYLALFEQLRQLNTKV